MTCLQIILDSLLGLWNSIIIHTKKAGLDIGNQMHHCTASSISNRPVAEWSKPAIFHYFTIIFTLLSQHQLPTYSSLPLRLYTRRCHATRTRIDARNHIHTSAQPAASRNAPSRRTNKHAIFQHFPIHYSHFSGNIDFPFSAAVAAATTAQPQKLRTPGAQHTNWRHTFLRRACWLHKQGTPDATAAPATYGGRSS